MNRRKNLCDEFLEHESVVPYGTGTYVRKILSLTE